MTAQMTCKNMFLEPDGFCSQCGKNHFKMRDASARANRQKAARMVARELTISERNAKIEAEISATPTYRTAKALALRIANDFGLDIQVIFRNRETSCANWKSGVVTFGYWNIDGHALNVAKGRPFREYAGLNYLVRKYRPATDIEAARWIAIHEIAHILDRELNGGYAYGENRHGARYAKIFDELLAVYLR